MKLDSYVGVITNSSSMLYVIRSQKMAERAREALAQYGVEVISSRELALDERVPTWHELRIEMAYVVRGLPEYRGYAVYRSLVEAGKNHEEACRAMEEYENWYAGEIKSQLLAKPEFWLFVPPRDDNEMSSEEMDDYERFSDYGGRLS